MTRKIRNILFGMIIGVFGPALLLGAIWLAQQYPEFRLALIISILAAIGGICGAAAS